VGRKKGLAVCLQLFLLFERRFSNSDVLSYPSDFRDLAGWIMGIYGGRSVEGTFSDVA